METIYVIISIVSLLFSIIILRRWWRMTDDINEIRNHLVNRNNSNSLSQEVVQGNDNFEVDEEQIIESMKTKLKPNQCIIKIKSNNQVKTINKEFWEEHIKQGRANYYELLFKNY